MTIESSAPILDLDEQSIDPASLSIPVLMRELNLQKRPSWLLVQLMNALERKRQIKGLGWSRSWNKYGMNTFRTHIHDIALDSEYFRGLRPLLDSFMEDAPQDYREFIDDLFSDPKRMAFTFYHNNTLEDGQQFEGLTLSIGRKVASDASKRDRLDVILEDARNDGRVDGIVDRLRIYACPWKFYQHDKVFHLCERIPLSAAELKIVQPLYSDCLKRYHIWKHEESRQWSHWSARYMDYFGPRTFIPQGSSFT